MPLREICLPTRVRSFLATQPPDPADEHPEMRKLYSSLREEVRNSESPPPASAQHKKKLTMPPI